VSNGTDISSRIEGALTRTRLVSVVVPAYNAAPYITATLESVFAQTFTDLEVLVVNDGSPDTADLEIALKPRQSQIRYIRQENRGPSSARNAGIRSARGKYVAFLDSDDFWLPHHLAKQVEHLEADPSLQMVYANGLLLRGNLPAGILFDGSPQSLPIDLDCLLQERSTVITSSVVALRQALVDIGMFDEQFRRVEDYDLWLRLVQSGGRISFTREIQIHHRQANGLAANWKLMRRALIQVYEKHLALATLNEQQARFVRQKIHSITMAIDFQDAKQALLDGQFSTALESVQKVQRSAPSWKVALAQIGLRRFPRLLRSLYRLHLKRLEQQYRERNARSLKKAGFDGLPPNTETFGDPTLT
jgi:glycosyltransferase involved in cell wall biosynthesis